MQINAAETEDALRNIFLNEQFTYFVEEMGFRRPLNLLGLDEKGLVSSLREYHTLVKGRMELDGLSTHNVLQMIRNEPKLMKPLFVSHGAELV